MTGNINANKLGLSVGIAGAVLSVLCALLIALAPAFTIGVFGAIFHGIDISQIANTTISFGGVILGIIDVFIIGYIFGWLVGSLYNKLQ